MVILACDEPGQTSASCMCPGTNFVASPASGEALLATLPAGSARLLSLPEVIKLGREAFGELLTGERREPPDADQGRS
jgi:hypothetical protein